MNTWQAPAANVSWRAMCGADPTQMSRADLSTYLSHIERVRGVCDAGEVVAIRRGRELAHAGNAESPESVLTRETGRSARDARVAAQRETACAAVPEFQTALAAGDMSAGHIDAAAAAMQRLDAEVAAEFSRHGAALVGRAGRLDVDTFQRECRDLARHLSTMADNRADVDELEHQRAASTVKRWVDRSTGMHNTLLSLDPLRDSTVWTIINTQIARERQRNQHHDIAGVSWNELQASAVVAAIVGTGAGGGAGGGGSDRASGGGRTTGSSRCERVPEIGILIDWKVLTADAAEAGVCETIDGVPLPIATVRRLCCDAFVYPAVLGADGELLDQGRARRTATRAQRRALAAMHRGCAFPGCTMPFDSCRIHHIRWWWQHLGPTDIDNLLPLCERHHHLVHEGGWTLTMAPDRVATWGRPDGAVPHCGQTIDRRPADRPMRC